MNKFLTKIAKALLGLSMAIGVGVAIGSKNSLRTDATTGEVSFTGGTVEFGGSSGSFVDSDDNTWTYTKSDSIAKQNLNNSYRQVGTKNNPSTLTIETSAITNTITQIDVDCASFGGNHNIAITVGEEIFLSAESTPTWSSNSGGVKTGTGSASGTITISFTKGNKSWRALYIKSVTVTYEESGGDTPTEYTVSYAANGLAGSQMSNSTGESITLKSNEYTLPNGAEFLGWNTANDGSGTNYDEGQSVTANLSLYANWGYPVTYVANGSGELNIVDHTVKNTSYSVKKNSFEYDGYIFLNWNTDEEGAGSDYAEDQVISTPSGALTLYAQWDEDPCDVDILDDAFTGVSGTSYTSWSDKSGSASTAVYAGISTHSHSAIQLKKGDNSGIISTTSGGTLTRVKVVWESNTADGRTLDIYGKNEAYKATSELYDSNNQGEKLGSIVCGTSTSINISGDYAYIGLRSNDGAMYLTQIKIAWMPVTSFQVQYNLNGGTEGTVPTTVGSLNSDDLASFEVADVPNDFYKFGYNCDGWASSSSGSLEYTAGNSYDLTSKVSGALVTLYAHWSIRTITGLTAGSTEPTNKVYEVGQSFDPAGLTIHAVFNNTYEDPTDITSQVSWSALQVGSTAQGSFTFNNVPVNITISGLTITGPDVVINSSTVPSNVTSSTNDDIRTGYIGSINYKYRALQTFTGDVLEFKNSSTGYISNLDSYGKYISSIKVTMQTDSFSYFTVYQGTEAEPDTSSVNPSGSNTTRTYTFSSGMEYFTFKKTNSTSTWIKIEKIEIYLGNAVPEKVVNTVTISDPGTIYEGQGKQLSATVTYIDTNYTDSNVTWEKVSGTSTISQSGYFEAADTTTTVVRATSVKKNSENEFVSVTLSITPVEKLIKDGHKYFVVSGNNEILLAKGLDGSVTDTSSSKREQFFSTVTLSSNGKYVISINGISADSLTDYAWTFNEADTNKFTLKNSNGSYFNIWSSGNFYIDTGAEQFTYSPIGDSGLYSMYGHHSETYLNISNGAFVTNQATATTGFKLLEYKEYGTFDHFEINEALTKTEYFLNDTFKLTDVCVVAYDTNGIPKTLTSDYTCSGYDLSNSGQQTVTVTYSGKTDSYNINVIKWRSVKETAPSQTGTYDFSSISSSTTTNMSTETFSTYYSKESSLSEGSASLTGIFADSSGCLKLSSNSSAGNITITFAEDVKITSVSVRAKLYGSDSTTLTVMGNNISELTSNFVDYNYSVDSGHFSETNIFNLHVDATKKRCYIESIVISTGGEKEIGKDTDCLNLEKFIDTYLRSNLAFDPDPTLPVNNTTECKSLYPAARKAFNNEEGAGAYALNDHQRELFATNDAYANERARLQAWALANQDELNLSTHLLVDVNSSPLLFALNADNRNTVAIIVIISMVSITAIGGYFFLRKRKEQ